MSVLAESAPTYAPCGGVSRVRLGADGLWKGETNVTGDVSGGTLIARIIEDLDADQPLRAFKIQGIEVQGEGVGAVEVNCTVNILAKMLIAANSAWREHIPCFLPDIMGETVAFAVAGTPTTVAGRLGLSGMTISSICDTLPWFEAARTEFGLGRFQVQVGLPNTAVTQVIRIRAWGLYRRGVPTRD